MHRPSSPFKPLVPDAVPIDRALSECEPLVRLGQRLALSNACFAAIQPVLPPPLRPHVAPGPLDEEGWTLLAGNAGVAAKLRQLMPRLEAALPAQAGQRIPIRVRVQSVQPGRRGNASAR